MTVLRRHSAGVDSSTTVVLQAVHAVTGDLTEPETMNRLACEMERAADRLHVPRLPNAGAPLLVRSSPKVISAR